jgi:PKD repeat protein
VIQAISDYLDNADIDFLKGSIEVNPKIGNAPLNVTLRADITDPTGAVIPSHNYTWWFDVGGERVVIGRGLSLNYTFREEGNYSVFLDVVSNHRNELGNIDVLPFRSRADIIVEEKIASLIVKVNGQQVTDNGVLKFTPNEAGYGLLFDATSSTPTGGARFTSTEWDFGNGVTRRYN